MKIIFSRKGFDDAYGGHANLILPDGRLLVFPIPEKTPFEGIPYEDIMTLGRPLSRHLEDLHITLPKDCSGAHLDPDIIPDALERHPDWRPVFGSHGSANSHLKNEGVGLGDIFLFFGSFRPVEKGPSGAWRYIAAPPVHIIFSWMRVGEVIDLATASKIPDWCQTHPHVRNHYGNSNALYLSYRDDDGNVQAGPLSWREDRVLTRGGFRKSQWLLPWFFHPDFGTRISRHGNKGRFTILPGAIMLDTVAIGQDFVVRGDDRISEWAHDLIRDR